MGLRVLDLVNQPVKREIEFSSPPGWTIALVPLVVWKPARTGCIMMLDPEAKKVVMT
jgi:hypothetical protein